MVDAIQYGGRDPIWRPVSSFSHSDYHVALLESVVGWPPVSAAAFLSSTFDVNLQ